MKKPLTLNRGDDTVSIVDYHENTSVAVPVRRNLNHLLVAPGGRRAVAYYDTVKAEEENETPDLTGSGCQETSRCTRVPPGFNAVTRLLMAS